MTDILLSESERRIVQSILQTHCKNTKVFAFGSRVKGNAKPYSDLDLVIKADNVLDLSDIACLKDEFCHSDLIFKVDICDWQSLDDDFKKALKMNWC